MAERESIYTMLTEGTRQIDEQQGAELLKRIVEGMDPLYFKTFDIIDDLSNTFIPAKCNPVILPYLAAQVGFGPDLSGIIANLNTITLRRLISLAVTMWKEKGTPAGLKGIIRGMTGISPEYLDWFDMRWIVGETEIGESGGGTDSWMIGGLSSEYDEYVSLLSLMDDGTLDRQLLLDLVGLVRPVSEYIEISIFDFLDVFGGGSRRKWSTYVGAPAVVESEKLVVTDGTIEIPLITVVDPLLMEDYYVSVLATFSESVLVIHIYANESKYYEVKVSPYGVGGSWHSVLTRFDTDGETVLATEEIPDGMDIVQDYPYTIEVSARNQGTDTRIFVSVDNVYVIDVIDSSATFNKGGVRIGAEIGTVLVDNVRVWRSPMRYAIVGPDGTETSSTYFLE